MEKSKEKNVKKNTAAKVRDKKEEFKANVKKAVAEEKAKEIEELKDIKIEKKEEPKKEERKTTKPKYKYESAKIQTEDQKEMFRFFIVLLVVILMVTGIYFLTRIFVTKDLGKKNNEAAQEEVVPANINYSVTSVGQILNRPYDSYYVLIYDTNGDYVTDAQSLLVSYNMKEKKKHVYRVDLSNYLNKDFYDKENVNPEAKSVSEFKFGDITLLYINKGKVEKYITDVSKMKTELGVN